MPNHECPTPSNIPEPLGTPERWTYYSKNAPLLGAILSSVDRLYGYSNDGIREENLYVGQRLAKVSILSLEEAYVRWQTVRVVKVKEVTGETTHKTGFEGYLYPEGGDGEKIIRTEAQMGQAILDEDWNNHPFENSRRNRLDEIIYYQQGQGTGVDLKMMYFLMDHFNILRRQCKNISDSFSSEGFKQNRFFRIQTDAATHNPPDMTMYYENGAFSHGYALPNIPVSDKPNCNYDPPHKYSEGMRLMEMIGIFGHPVMRMLQDLPIIRAKANSVRQFYAPRGSEKRDRLDFLELGLLIKQLERYYL